MFINHYEDTWRGIKKGNSINFISMMKPKLLESSWSYGGKLDIFWIIGTSNFDFVFHLES